MKGGGEDFSLADVPPGGERNRLGFVGGGEEGGVGLLPGAVGEWSGLWGKSWQPVGERNGERARDETVWRDELEELAERIRPLLRVGLGEEMALGSGNELADGVILGERGQGEEVEVDAAFAKRCG